MAMQQAFLNTCERLPLNDHVWCELYSNLRPYVLSWVYTSGVSSWHGQEHDIAEDILQEAIIRTLRYSKLAENGSGNPIHSISCFGRTVAQNHFRDLRRRDLRLVRPSLQDESEHSLFDMLDAEVDPADVALDRIQRVSLLLALVQIILDFPPKQRTALLIDMAKFADFDDEQCPVRAAFRSNGVDLQAYRSLLPPDPLQRSRHAASLSMAYKRLRQTFQNHYRDQF